MEFLRLDFFLLWNLIKVKSHVHVKNIGTYQKKKKIKIKKRLIEFLSYIILYIKYKLYFHSVSFYQKRILYYIT